MKCNTRLNKDICPCTEDCPRHGTCCLCIQHHIGNKMYPETACMRLGKLNR